MSNKSAGWDPADEMQRRFGYGSYQLTMDTLEEAVAAYRAALSERTRERVPLDWAQTQNNLGNALLRLGERESGAGARAGYLSAGGVHPVPRGHRQSLAPAGG